MKNLMPLTDAQHKLANDIAGESFDQGFNANTPVEYVYLWFMMRARGDENIANHAMLMAAMTVYMADTNCTMEEAMAAFGLMALEAENA
jgi:hypothetical protein